MDYPNGEPHLGHAFEKVGADCVARYKRLKGYETFLATGVDENSLNVDRTAHAAGEDTQDFVDRMSPTFKNLWDHLNISATEFVRTTEDRHVAAAQEFFRRAMDVGDIYKGKYEGWYCLSCENYYLEADLNDGLCPVHATDPEWFSEENYFFALSKYQDRLINHFEQNPNFVVPESRCKEVLNIVRSGLKDFSVSRSEAKWGIPVPGDPEQVIYVWFDALISYCTIVGFGCKDHSVFDRWWPADAHVIGKDILRFHAIYWPAMLMSVGLPLPSQIVGHGWIDIAGEAMSKTRGVVLDPREITQKYGVDPLRYYLLREVQFKGDGSFVWENLHRRYHSDLANDMGNLLNRTVSMIGRYCGGVLPKAKDLSDEDKILVEAASTTWDIVDRCYSDWDFSEALSAIWVFVAATNRYVDATQPFRLAKDSFASDRLDTILVNLAESVRQIAVMIAPAMPDTAERMLVQLGAGKILDGSWEEHSSWNTLTAGALVPGGKPIFPRID